MTTQHNIQTRRTARLQMIAPEDKEGVTDVIMALHGYGQLAQYFIKHFEGLPQHYMVVAPEALSRFYLKEWSGRIGASWMTSEDRLDEIADYIAYLTDVHSFIKSQLGQDFRLHLFGFSQGCETLCRWVIDQKILMDSITLHSGSIPLDADMPLFRSLVMDRLSIWYGTQDEIVPLAKFEALVSLIRSHNIPLKVTSFEGLHRIQSDLIRQRFV